MFIVFEGGEGSGKSTQARLLYQWLVKQGNNVLLTKEPGGDGSVCQDIRQVLLNEQYVSILYPLTEFFLFLSDRAQHVATVISPALEIGQVVVCDRFQAATFAYQCVARSVCSQREFEFMNTLATGGIVPDLTLWIDIDPLVGLKRNFEMGKRDRFEAEDEAFHRRVREGYLAYFSQCKDPWYKLDGSQRVDVLKRRVIERVEQLLGERK